MGQKILIDINEIDDEQIRARILARRKRQLRKKRQRRRLIFAIVVMLLLILNISLGYRYVKHQEYIKEMMVAGGDDWDGDSPLVSAARAELGNVGGEKYWSWYGFGYQVDWCACFVSWIADQTGYMQDGKVPMFSYVQEGVTWYREKDRWQGSEYEPKAGDIIFFDNNLNETADHVGIVSAVRDGRVFTIEGNAGWVDPDTGEEIEDEDYTGVCKRNGYDIGDKKILGYGIVDDDKEDSEEASE